MTLLIAYRHPHPTDKGQAAVFLNDFRLTWRKDNDTTQADAQMKWEFFCRGKNVQLAYMTAGTVSFWKFARTHVQGTLSQLDTENAASMGGPLHSALLQAALDYPEYLRRRGHGHDASRVGAIGLCMDCEADEVVFFVVRGKTGYGVEVNEIEPGSIEAIGSGATVPDLQERLESAATQGQRAYNNDLSSIGHGIRNEAMQAIQGAGGRAFAKLGVSPVMAMHVAEGARFRFLGERVVGNKTHKGIHYPSAYTLRGSSEHGFLLCDEVAGVHQPIQSDISDAEDAKDRGILDPENRTLSTDVSVHFPKMPCAYQFVQAKIKGVRFSEEQIEYLRSEEFHSLVEQVRDGAWFAKHVVYRRLSRIDFVGAKRLQQVKTLGERIEFVSSDDDFGRHSEIEVYFALDEGQRQKLEGEVAPDRLFDDAWIEDYAGDVFE